MPQQVRRAPEPSETWQVVGGALFGVGLLALLILIVPLFLGARPLPVEFALTALLAPAGAAVAMVGTALTRRRQR